MNTEYGEIVIYQSEDGRSSLEVHLHDESVWLTQANLAKLFQVKAQNITMHLKNIYAEGELLEKATCKKFLQVQVEGGRLVERKRKFYNLDAIISVGYRVKSLTATQFRIWATSVLKDHLIKGYTTNEHRLAEKSLSEMEETIALLSRTLKRHELITDEGKAVLEVVGRYAKSWSLLLKYDEDRLELPKARHPSKNTLPYDRAKEAISSLKSELIERGEAGDLFGQERKQHLHGILGSIEQSFGGKELYPSIEEKASHLLYFVIKDHPFSDGNKRIGSFLFLVFLRENNLLDRAGINENALVALALLIAESAPKQKELMIRLIMNLLAEN